MKVNLIYATSYNGVIGVNGDIPWRLPGDLKRFKEITNGHVVVMGRKTWESLPKKPLPGRVNIVISRQIDYVAPGAIVVDNVRHAFREAAKHRSGVDVECFVIGGEAIYQEAVPYASKHYITLIHRDTDGDAFAPTFQTSDLLKLWKPEQKSEIKNLVFISENSVDDSVHISDVFEVMKRIPIPSENGSRESHTGEVSFHDTGDIPVTVNYDYITLNTGPRSPEYFL